MSGPAAQLSAIALRILRQDGATDLVYSSADTVARQAYDAVMRGNVICVTGRVNRAIVVLTRCAPDWLIQNVLKRFAKKFRKV